jgi:hypothetical protein
MKAFSLGMAAAGLLIAVSAPGCGEDRDGPSTFNIDTDGGNGSFDGNADSRLGNEPDLDGGVDGLIGAGCAHARAAANKIPVYMLLVLDGSGSMDDDNKWKAVVPALDAVFDDLKAKADPAFGVGLTIFADMNDPTIGEMSAGPYNKMDVPVAFVDAVQHNKLHSRLDLTKPNLGTPTYEVLSGQYPLLEDFVPSAPLLPDGKKVLVFITDGVPDPDMPAGHLEAPWSINLADQEFKKASPKGPITTFSVGVGSLTPPPPGEDLTYDPKFCGALAMVGGAPKLPCDPNEKTDPTKMCHFQITPGGKTADQLRDEFLDALRTISEQILSCEFKLETTGNVDPTRVNVVYTSGAGKELLVPEDPANGWTYDNENNPTKVILHGSVCDNVKADPKGKVEIVLGCKTIIR